MYASVIVDADAPGLSQPFTYRVPEGIEGAVSEGACVAVPFAGRELVGYILELSETASGIDDVKDLLAVVPDACTLNPPLLRLARWMSEYYAAPLSHSVRAIVPGVMSARVSSSVRLLDRERAFPSSPNQQRIVEVLAALEGSADAGTLRARAKVDKFSAALRQLRARGAVEVVRTLELPKARPLIVQGLQVMEDEELPEIEEFASRAPKQAAILKELAESDAPIRRAELLRRVGSSSGPARALVKKGLAEKVALRVRRKPLKPETANAPGDLTPNEDQGEALDLIRRGLVERMAQRTLLYGVTGSGKTEVYLRSIADVLDRGGSCIALVPEISLTTYLMDVYLSRFGDRVAVLHSRLSVGERHDEWRRIESGEARVVLGPRSAVFAPVRNLGLVVVDEEHEPSYKQEHSPRYNARMVAEERANSEDASVVLGSATPAIETFYRARSGGIELSVLGKRVDDRPLPVVKTVDLREEFEQGHRSIFSEELEGAIADRLNRGEQAILFVNRRGYASFMLCRSCGYAARCDNCDVSLTYHSGRRQLRCHHCDAHRPAPTVCPKCGGPHVRQFGVGTERVEEEVRRIFRSASVIRMDADTTRRKNSYAVLLQAFREGKADILVGTQMVAKGLDFPNATLVGVISADTSLHLPDFRAAERTFQLLTQVSGRAGRGDIPGEVIVQSFSPEHYAVQAAARQDYPSFYEREIAYRRELSYPPFARLINVVSSDSVESYAEEKVRELAREIEGHIPRDVVDVVGPAPAPLAKLKGLYRWHLMLRDRGSAMPGGLPAVVRDAVDRMPSAARSGITIDVDPLTML